MQSPIDVVGINEADKRMLLGRALWRTEVADPVVMRDLVARTAEAIPGKGQWSVYYFGFSSSGWTEDAADLIQKMIDRTSDGKNWKASGFRLLDLHQVDDDLYRWSNGLD